MSHKKNVLKAFPKAHCLIAAFKPRQRYIVWAGRAAPDIMLGMGGTPAQAWHRAAIRMNPTSTTTTTDADQA